MSIYFAYVTNLLFYECTITATAKGCYPESGEINENFRKTVINSYLRVLHFFNLAHCMIQMIILLYYTANQMNCLG